MGNTRAKNGDGTGQDRVLLGAIAGARGLKGEVRIKSFTADPEAIGDYGPLVDEAGTRTFKVTVTGLQKGQVVARIAGVSDRTAADALKGTRLYVDRGALPAPDEDEFYHADLIGLEARDGAGTVLGRIGQVFDHGAGVFLEVEDPKGAHPPRMVPFTRAAVPVVNVAQGWVEVVPPEDVVAGPAGGADADEAENG